MQAIGVEADPYQPVDRVEASDHPVVGAPRLLVEAAEMRELHPSELGRRRRPAAPRTLLPRADLHELERDIRLGLPMRDRVMHDFEDQQSTHDRPGARAVVVEMGSVVLELVARLRGIPA